MKPTALGQTLWESKAIDDEAVCLLEVKVIFFGTDNRHHACDVSSESRPANVDCAFHFSRPSRPLAFSPASANAETYGPACFCLCAHVCLCRRSLLVNAACLQIYAVVKAEVRAETGHFFVVTNRPHILVHPLRLWDPCVRCESGKCPGLRCGHSADIRPYASDLRTLFSTPSLVLLVRNRFAWEAGSI